MAVGATVNVIGHDVGMRVAAAFRNLARGEVIHDFVDQPGHLRIDKGEVDVLTLARFISVAEGGQETDRCIHPAHDIRDTDASFHGVALWRASQGYGSVIALGHEIIARFVSVRAGFAVARD